MERVHDACRSHRVAIGFVTLILPSLVEIEPVEAKSPEQIRADRDPAAVISPQPLSLEP